LQPIGPPDRTRSYGPAGARASSARPAPIRWRLGATAPTRLPRATGPSFVRRRRDAVAAAVGLVVLGLGLLVVRDGAVPDVEADLFHAVNGLPSSLYVVLWPFQQLGNLVVGPLVAVGAALTRRF